MPSSPQPSPRPTPTCSLWSALTQFTTLPVPAFPWPPFHFISCSAGFLPGLVTLLKSPQTGNRHLTRRRLSPPVVCSVLAADIYPPTRLLRDPAGAAGNLSRAPYFTLFAHSVTSFMENNGTIWPRVPSNVIISPLNFFGNSSSSLAVSGSLS